MRCKLARVCVCVSGGGWGGGRGGGGENGDGRWGTVVFLVSPLGHVL